MFLQPASRVWLTTFSLLLCLCLYACEAVDPQAEELCKNTQLQLVDWHISGLWVINSPVAWVKVTNLNDVPIHEVTFEYNTSASDGRALDHGVYTIEGTVPPHSSKNFVELYLGLVDLYTEGLRIKLLSVHRES